MAGAAAAQWWDQTLDELGVQGMDRSLSRDAGWEEILQSGREEFSNAQAVIPLRTGRNRKVLDVGCGVGRLSFALAEHFGEVVGVDISGSLIAAAVAHNTSPQIRFHLLTERRLEPGQQSAYDTVFANEVLYYLPWNELTDYCRDAYRLLRPQGELAFQLNLEPIPWQTRISWFIRQILFRCGVRSWRGWSNGPGFRRYHHPVAKVRRMLDELGFRVLNVGTGQSIRQTWFLAVKPDSQESGETD